MIRTEPFDSRIELFWQQFRDIRELKDIDDETLRGALSRAYSYGCNYLEREKSAEELIGFTNHLRSCIYELNHALYAYGEMTELSQLLAGELSQIDADTRLLKPKTVVVDPLPQMEKLVDQLVDWVDEIAPAAGSFKPVAGRINRPAKKPTRSIDGAVVGGMATWRTLTGKDIASAKTLEYAGGRVAGKRSPTRAVRPQSNDAYFVYLCTKMVVDCTPSNTITAINFQRKRMKVIQELLNAVRQDGRRRRRDLEKLSSLYWSLGVGILPKPSDSSD